MSTKDLISPQEEWKPEFSSLVALGLRTQIVEACIGAPILALFGPTILVRYSKKMQVIYKQSTAGDIST